MDQLVNIVENNMGTFDHLHGIDSYVIANRIKRILGERGYKMVENKKEADDYFTKKYGNQEQSYEIEERGIRKVVDGVTYTIKLHRYFYDADRIYSVLVTEL